MSYQNGIINNLIENTIEIYFADDPDPEATKITQSNIVSESMTLKQSVCDSETLTYGGCIASEFNIELLNTADRSFSSALTGKWISVKITQHYADPACKQCLSRRQLVSRQNDRGKSVLGFQRVYRQRDG